MRASSACSTVTRSSGRGWSVDVGCGGFFGRELTGGPRRRAAGPPLPDPRRRSATGVGVEGASGCAGDRRRRAAEQSGDLACTQGWHEHDASSLHLHAYMMHLVDSGWMLIREAKHEVLAVTARTPIEPRAPGSLRASRVAGANGASRRRAPGPAGSASSSIAVVTASGGAATGPTSGGVTVS